MGKAKNANETDDLYSIYDRATKKIWAWNVAIYFRTLDRITIFISYVAWYGWQASSSGEITNLVMDDGKAQHSVLRRRLKVISTSSK